VLLSGVVFGDMEVDPLCLTLFGTSPARGEADPFRLACGEPPPPQGGRL